MKNVLIIGAGNRVQTTVLPALIRLKSKFRVVGIVNRHEIPELKTSLSLDDYDFSKINIIFIAVTITEVPNVLIRLLKYRHHNFTIYLDTPAFYYRHFWALLILICFKNVLVSEEYPYLSFIAEAKRLIDKGTIGRVKHIAFFNFGYEYHGLAVLKYLTNSSPWLIRSQKIRDNFISKKVYFHKGIKATVFEPHSDTSWRFLIVGERGAIANYPLINTTWIKTPANTDFKELKIRAFMELILNPRRYSPLEAFIDQIRIMGSERSPLII